MVGESDSGSFQLVTTVEGLDSELFEPVLNPELFDGVTVRRMAAYTIDLAIIDLGLPGMSGLEIIRKVRAKGKTYPILILTARDRWEDKVDGLSAGADDYVVKPFHFEEIGARVNALLRRSGGWASSVLEADPVALDMTRQELKVNGELIELTSFEYKIIEFLMIRAGQVISKAELTDRLYDQDFERDSNVIEVFIGRLRRKMDPDNSINPIETLRGRGYRFALERNQSG